MFKNTHIFSADHPVVAHSWRSEGIATRQERDGGWFAIHPGLGCSNTFSTPEAAILDMVQSHGCTNIEIKPIQAEAVVRDMQYFKRGSQWWCHIYFSDGSYWPNCYGPFKTKRDLIDYAVNAYDTISRGIDE
jgi:hypothetical protein